MLPRLPEYVDPWRLAASGTRFAGQIPLSAMSRLVEVLIDRAGDVTFEIEFYLDEKRRACLRGRVDAALSLQCQRCLGKMVVPVRGQVAAVFVHGFDEAQRAPDGMDPVVVEEDERLRVVDLIEDELLLALPQAPMHRPDECHPDWADRAPKPEADEVIAERENPFAVLSALKKETTNKT